VSRVIAGPFRESGTDGRKVRTPWSFARKSRRPKGNAPGNARGLHFRRAKACLERGYGKCHRK